MAGKHGAEVYFAPPDRVTSAIVPNKPFPLYRIIEEDYPDFLELLASQGRSLPGYVQREFEDYLKCGRLAYGFLRVRCQDCHDVFQ